MTAAHRPRRSTTTSSFSSALASRARSLGACVALLSLVTGGLGCVAPSAEDTAASEDAYGARADTTKPPVTVSVPIRFTKNRLDDVGYFFGNSQLPLTGNVRERPDPMDWANQIAAARQLATYYQPDRIGSGYVTADFRFEIPRDVAGGLAYGLAKLRLETEYIDANVADYQFFRHSPLRMRTGTDQPCLAVVMTGALEGKLSVHDVPWYDEGFTEREWTAADRDAKGRPVRRVIVGSIRFAPISFAEKVDGATRASGGVGAAGGSLMINLDRSSGEASATHALVHVNLLENDRGELSVGTTFSTTGAILTDAQKAQFDARARAHITEFMRQAECWARNPLKPRRADGKCVP